VRAKRAPNRQEPFLRAKRAPWAAHDSEWEQAPNDKESSKTASGNPGKNLEGALRARRFAPSSGGSVADTPHTSSASWALASRRFIQQTSRVKATTSRGPAGRLSQN
jgi:hypothetical protein